ncbi:hypothetical protein [Nostoc phage A1]|nr:hypothetical protein [Nostoc phage A1]
MNLKPGFYKITQVIDEYGKTHKMENNMIDSNVKTIKLITGATYKFLINDDLKMIVNAVFKEIEIDENVIKYTFQIDGNDYKLTEGILRKFLKLPMK